MIVIGIGEVVISQDEKESLITYALGSCVAIIVWCPLSKKTALAHIVLPENDRGDQSSYITSKPAYFADEILPRIFREFTQSKKCTLNQLKVSVVGGAVSQRPYDFFKVGTKNVEHVMDYLSKLRLQPKVVDVGGNDSRTVEVSIANGKVSIRKQKMLI